MIEAVRQWITGLAAAAVIGALAQCLMPEGSVKRAGKLAVGLLLMLAVVRPVAQLDYDALSGALARYQLQAEGYGDALELENRALVKSIIEEQLAAYISDKAEELGITCTVRVVCRCGEDGDIWPESAEVTGELTQEQRGRLARLLETELAIREENQTFERTADK